MCKRMVNGDFDIQFWDDVRDIGSELNPIVIEKSFSLCSSLFPDIENDMDRTEHSYGSHERNRLDLYLPVAPRQKPTPCLMFVHGGGYVNGDKRMGTPFFANIGLWAASQGWACAIMNYRLAPDHSWPSVQEDIGQSLAWLVDNAKNFSIHPESIVLMGHSAGAGHCAAYATNPEFHKLAGGGFAGLMLMSGTYDLAAAGDFGAASRSHYYGTDATEYSSMSSTAGLSRIAQPITVISAELDPPELLSQAKAAIAAIESTGLGRSKFVLLEGHNHYTEVLTIGSAFGNQLHDEMYTLIMCTHNL